MTRHGPTLTRVDLGRAGYDDAYALQQAHHAAVLNSRDSGVPEVGRLLLVEHVPPVITISRRPDARRHLTATQETLAAEGVQVRETDRGGDITYHGPGQLVAYPIVDLNTLRLNLHGYIRLLEDVVMRSIAHFGVRGERERGATGVWVASAKICAIGVRVKRWVTMHGLALNVTTNLRHFDLIVPCGLAGRRVTSLQQQLDDRCPTMDEVKRVIEAEFDAALTRVSGPSEHRP